MKRDFEGSHCVARTKVRLDETSARHVEELLKNAKPSHHEAGPNQRQSSSSQSSGVIRPQEELKLDHQDDLKKNEDDDGRI